MCSPRSFNPYLWNRTWTALSIVLSYLVAHVTTPCHFDRTAPPVADGLKNVRWVGDACYIPCRSAMAMPLVIPFWTIFSTGVSVAIGYQATQCSPSLPGYTVAELCGVIAHVFLVTACSFHFRRAEYIACDEWSPYALVLALLTVGLAFTGVSIVYYNNSAAKRDDSEAAFTRVLT